MLLLSWHWFILGFVLLAFEILGTAGYLLWLGLSAILVGIIVTLIVPSTTVQFVLYAVFCIITTVFWWRYQHQKDKKSDKKRTLNNKENQLVGKEVYLENVINKGSNRLKLGDTTWTAYSDENIDLGAKIIITKLEGNVVYIKKVEE